MGQMCSLAVLAVNTDESQDVLDFCPADERKFGLKSSS